MTSLSESKINSRRNWKAETFPYDYFFPDETKECQYCLTDKQAELLRGILQPVGWLTRWWSETDATIDRDTIETFRDDMIRRLMMPCCGDEVILFRYDEDGNLEKSEDGGTVYTPSPLDDIRVYPRVIFPPPPVPEGEDIRCEAADSAVTLIKQQIGDQLTDDMSRYTLQQLIKDWTDNVVGTSTPFQALLIIVTNQLFALLISAVRAALTDSVYDKLRCILQTRMNSVAFFDGAAWEDVRSDILTQITGIAGAFLEHLVYLIGNGGLSNLARSGAGSPEAVCCPDCDPTSWHIVNYEGVDVGTINSVGSNYLILGSTVHPEFGTHGVMIQTDADNQCCVPIELLYLTGDTAGRADFGVDCGDARWPDSPTHGFSLGEGSLNTFYERNTVGAFTIRVTFA